MLIDDLNNAKVGKPFETLGLQKVEGKKGLLLRAWLPGAKAVDVYSINGKKKICKLTLVDEDGLFEEQLKTEKPFNYLFKVTYDDAVVEVIDPYQFRDEAFYGLSTMNEEPANIYKTLGAQLVELDVDGVKVKGTKFAVYAPSATAVSVIGDFNFWDGRRYLWLRAYLATGYYSFLA